MPVPGDDRTDSCQIACRKRPYQLPTKPHPSPGFPTAIVRTNSPRYTDMTFRNASDRPFGATKSQRESNRTPVGLSPTSPFQRCFWRRSYPSMPVPGDDHTNRARSPAGNGHKSIPTDRQQLSLVEDVIDRCSSPGRQTANQDREAPFRPIDGQQKTGDRPAA